MSKRQGVEPGRWIDGQLPDNVQIGSNSVITSDYALISWNVVLMDCYRCSFDPQERRRELRQVSSGEVRRLEGGTAARPIRIGRNVWIGFDACILPGVTIGEGSVVGAKSVVVEDVPPYSVVGGNPACLIRRLDEGSKHDPH